MRSFSAVGTIYVEMYEPDISNSTSTFYRLQPAVTIGLASLPEPLAIRVWPNPVRSTLCIEAGAPVTVRAFSVTGRLVLPEQRLAGFTEPNAAEHAPGVYVRRASERWGEMFTVVR